MKIEIAGQLSDRSQPLIERAVRQAIYDMPKALKNMLSEARVILARRLTDIYPEASDVALEKDPHKTHEYLVAGYDRGRKTINIAQMHMKDSYVIKQDRLKDYDNAFDAAMNAPTSDYSLVAGYDVAMYNLYGVFFHEAGHAFSDFGGHYSQSPEMREAYDKDIEALQRMDLDERHALLEKHGSFFSTQRFNQAKQLSNEVAREEVFAEAFAKILGGINNSGNPEHAEEHKRIFVHSYKCVEQIILNVAPDARLYPTHERVYSYCGYEEKKPVPKATNFSFNAAATNAPEETSVFTERVEVEGKPYRAIDFRLPSFGP